MTDEIKKEGDATEEAAPPEENKFDAKEAIGALSQKLGSELGRAQKTQEAVDVLGQQMTDFMETFKASAAAAAATPASETYVSTKDDVVGVIQEIKNKEAADNAKYQRDYTNNMIALVEKEKLTDKEIMRLEGLTQTSFKDSRSGFQNPVWDAESNFDKAMRVIDKERPAKKGVDLKGDNPLGAGVGSGDNPGEKDAAMPKLDKFAADFVAAHGTSAEKVNKALGKELPGGLRKKGF